MTLRIRKVKRDSQSVLLVVHDSTGRSHHILEALALLLKDIAEDNPRCSAYLSEVSPQEYEDDRPAEDSDTRTTSK